MNRFLRTLTIGALLASAPLQGGWAATLKASATLDSTVLTAGDIFGDIDAGKAETVLGTAPMPGQDLVLNSNTLLRISLALGLGWHPQTSGDQITIRRAATLIEQQAISDKISAALSEQGLHGDFRLVFSNIVAPQLVLPADMPATFEIEGVKYDPSGETFEATLMAPNRDKPLSQLFVRGEVRRMIKVPVLSETVRMGEPIRASQISWISMDDKEVQHDIVMKADDIVGLTPRRILVAGKPVRDRELEQMRIVARGDTVTITFNNGPMTLTAVGRALQDGAKQDVIRVLNASSNKPVEAIVTAERTVRVIN